MKGERYRKIHERCKNRKIAGKTNIQRVNVNVCYSSTRLKKTMLQKNIESWAEASTFIPGATFQTGAYLQSVQPLAWGSTPDPGLFLRVNANIFPRRFSDAMTRGGSGKSDVARNNIFPGFYCEVWSP